MNELSNRERSLVAIGAAIASNCVPCVEYHIPAAKRTGLSDHEIHAALRIADKVRQVPSRAVFEAALARIDTSRGSMAESSGQACDCGASKGPGARGGVC